MEADYTIGVDDAQFSLAPCLFMLSIPVHLLSLFLLRTILEFDHQYSIVHNILQSLLMIRVLCRW